MKLPIEKSKGPWKKGKKLNKWALAEKVAKKEGRSDARVMDLVQNYDINELKEMAKPISKKKELENKYLGKKMKTMFGNFGKVVSIGEDPDRYYAIVEDKDGDLNSIVVASKRF